MQKNSIGNLLGGLTQKKFLAEYWQKKPLLIRQAIAQFEGTIDRDSLCRLACREDVQSRLIWQSPEHRWEILCGPLRKRDFPARKHPWTVLVQGLNEIDPRADELLQRFNFIPYTRLDDVMVSYATDGGGVGPHFDSYDVFLLQAMGTRRWQISAQRDLQLVDDAPLKILSHFEPEQEWLLEPGDMLYLPPHYAHNGIAQGECMTYSIGFRAPSAQELVGEFLMYLQENFVSAQMYSDPDLIATQQPAMVSDAMVDRVGEMLAKIKWSSTTVATFLGQYLSEPKPHILFDPPHPLMTVKTFRKQAGKGIRLDLRTRMLYKDRTIFINGESVRIDSKERSAFAKLANARKLNEAFENISESGWSHLYEWYRVGYLHLCIG